MLERIEGGIVDAAPSAGGGAILAVNINIACDQSTAGLAVIEYTEPYNRAVVWQAVDAAARAERGAHAAVRRVKVGAR